MLNLRPEKYFGIYLSENFNIVCGKKIVFLFIYFCICVYMFVSPLITQVLVDSFVRLHISVALQKLDL